MSFKRYKIDDLGQIGSSLPSLILLGIMKKVRGGSNKAVISTKNEEKSLSNEQISHSCLIRNDKQFCNRSLVGATEAICLNKHQVKIANFFQPLIRINCIKQ
jgi:hypothetical protein